MASERLEKIQNAVNATDKTKNLSKETTKTDVIVIPEGLDTSELKHLAMGIKDGVAKKGFTILPDGKVVGTKKLLELINQ